MNPFATHMPVLLACLEHTSGPVLELGSGWFSTPVAKGASRSTTTKSTNHCSDNSSSNHSPARPQRA